MDQSAPRSEGRELPVVVTAHEWNEADGLITDPAFDFLVTFSDLIGLLLEEPAGFDRLEAIVGAIPGIAAVRHEDREVLLVASRLDPEAVRRRIIDTLAPLLRSDWQSIQWRHPEPVGVPRPGRWDSEVATLGLGWPEPPRGTRSWLAWLILQVRNRSISMDDWAVLREVSYPASTARALIRANHWTLDDADRCVLNGHIVGDLVIPGGIDAPIELAARLEGDLLVTEAFSTHVGVSGHVTGSVRLAAPFPEFHLFGGAIEGDLHVTGEVDVVQLHHSSRIGGRVVLAPPSGFDLRFIQPAVVLEIDRIEIGGGVIWGS